MACCVNLECSLRGLVRHGHSLLTHSGEHREHFWARKIQSTDIALRKRCVTASLPPQSQDRLSTFAKMRGLTISLLALLTASVSWSACTVNADPIHPITYTEFVNKMRLQWHFNGEQDSGVSRSTLRTKFKGLLKEKVNEFMKKSIGGLIEDFGEKRWWPRAACEKRPALKMADVINLAQQSFNITDFEPSIPPCRNDGTLCNAIMIWETAANGLR